MTTRSVNIPRVLDIRRGAHDGLPELLAKHFDVARIIIACGVTSSAALARGLAPSLEAGGSTVEIIEAVSGTIQASTDLEARLREHRPTLVVAVGGGRPIDTAKLASRRVGLPFVSVPTVLSHDGMASPVASLVADDGIRRSLAASMPSGVIIDLAVVGASPTSHLRAGIGDLVSNLTAVADWRLAAEGGGEPVDEFAASIALQSAFPALDLPWPLDDVGLQLVARGLVMSGLAMEVAGSSRPCSGAEHLFSHALDQMLGSDARAHGEQVALGVLLMAAPSGLPIERVRSLYARIGLPTDLKGWSLDRKVIAEALRLAPGTRPGRVTVLDRLDLSGAGADTLIGHAFDDDR